MAPSAVLVSFLFCVLCFYTPTNTAQNCQSSCPGSRDVKEFRFPFGLNDTANNRCSYPGFNISCTNQNRTILTFPNSVQLAVLHIDYKIQRIKLEDPNSCNPGRFLDGSLHLDGSPFRVVTDDHNFWDPRGLLLEWSTPDCGRCEQRGRTCEFKSNQSLEIRCSASGVPSEGTRVVTCGFKPNQSPENRHSGVPSEGPWIPRSAKYGIIIGVGIPGLLCLIGLSCYICGKVNTYTHRRHHPTIEFLASIALQPALAGGGLDEPTIESYPKTLLGESRRLPNPSDNTCSICLSEYQPKEALRTIPECKHYFHADCIDEWLRMNTTCPLCRNSPGRWMSITPSTSLSSSSSSLSSVV